MENGFDSVVEYNVIHDSTTAIGVINYNKENGDGFHADKDYNGLMTNTIIRNNYFHTYHAKVNIRESDQVSISNNMFVGGPINSFVPQQYGVFNGNATNVFVKNNFFYDINGGTTSLIYNVPSANVMNNIPSGANGSRNGLVYVSPQFDSGWHPTTNSPVQLCSGGVGGTYIGVYPCGAISSTLTLMPTKTPTKTPTRTPTVSIRSSNMPTGTPKPGDANGDGLVDGADYVIWERNFGRNVSGAANGNFDNQGLVDGADYLVWVNHYGK